MNDDIFTPEQLAAMVADRPVLVTAEELGRLFGLPADEIRGLAAEGLLVDALGCSETRGNTSPARIVY